MLWGIRKAGPESCTPALYLSIAVFWWTSGDMTSSTLWTVSWGASSPSQVRSSPNGKSVGVGPKFQLKHFVGVKPNCRLSIARWCDANWVIVETNYNYPSLLCAFLVSLVLHAPVKSACENLPLLLGTKRSSSHFSAFCALATPWESFVIGISGALISLGGVQILKRLKIDDPVGKSVRDHLPMQKNKCNPSDMNQLCVRRLKARDSQTMLWIVNEVTQQRTFTPTHRTK